MTSYIISFVVYTTAMVGAIFLALFVYKKFAISKNYASKSKFLAVEDCISLGVRKQLYIIRAGNEKFLIASDTERTTFLAKLNSDNLSTTNLNEIFEKNADLIKSDISKKKDKEEEIFFLNDINKSAKDAGEILHNIVSSGGRQ